MINEKLCRFYSPNWLSSLLIDSLPTLSPKVIVDLGSGPGSLSDAAAARWPSAKIATVDVDPRVKALRPQNNSTRLHVCRNVLADGLPKAIGIEPGTADLVISNPPYTRVDRSRSINRVLARAGLQDVVSGWDMIPVELAFLAQALLLVRPSGMIAFVVPDTLISSELLKAVRRLLLREHQFKTVIQLPRRTFERTDAQAFVLVIRKAAYCEKINLRAVDESGRTEADFEISAEAGIRRLDCLFHAASHPSAGNTLSDLGVVVTRGRSNSRHVSDSKGLIFHTSDFPTRPGGSVSVSKASENHAAQSGGVIAQAGDILMARVDRRLEHKIAVVSGATEISDCVLCLRVPEAARDRVLKGLVSNEGRSQLSATSRGTGARHISHKSVLAIRV